MIKFQEDFRTLIISSPVGPLVSNRVSWGYRFQNSPVPAITLLVVGEGSYYVYQGVTNFTQFRVQLDIFANDYVTADSIDRALVSLKGYKGVVGATDFMGVIFISRFDDSEETGVVSQRVHRVSRDIHCNWKEK